MTETKIMSRDVEQGHILFDESILIAHIKLYCGAHLLVHHADMLAVADQLEAAALAMRIVHATNTN